MQIPATLQLMRADVQGDRRPLVLSGVLGVLVVVIDLGRPWPLALAVESITDHRTPSGLPLPLTVVTPLCALALVAITAVSGWLDAQSRIRAEQAAERIGSRLRGRVFGHLIGLSLRWHDSTRSGEIVSRLGTDVGRLLDALVALCSTVLADVLRLLAVLVVLIVIEPKLALVALLVLPVLAGLAVRQRERVRASQDDARAASGRFGAGTVDLLRNIRLIQGFGRDDLARDRFARLNTDLLRADQTAVRTEARWAPIADVTLAVGTGTVLAVGGDQALAGRLSAAELIVVMSYLSALYSPVRSLSRLSGVLARAGASARRIADVLDRHDRLGVPVDPMPVPLSPSGIRFAGVRFGYHPGREVLAGVDLVVRPGETVCLLGPSGAGKSTVLHLLLRLYDPDAGMIMLDGVDLRAYDPVRLRQAVAFVPQDPWLLDSTVADNIAFGTPSATRHGVLRAARLARVDEFVRRLPQGYDTPVGEAGARLSGGQKRRVALARAIVADAPLLLLDEPTASLDPESAGAVVDAIRGASRGRTVLIVTHDPWLATLADRVLRIDGLDHDRPGPATHLTTEAGEHPASDHLHPSRKEVPA